MRKLLPIWVIIGLAISLFAPLIPLSGRAAPYSQILTDIPPSNEPPEGYTPLESEGIQIKVASGSADILLVQTSLPWGSDANTQVLSELGYAYDMADMSSIAQIDLFRYPVILIVNDQVQEFYDQYANQVAAFENYVSDGGTLVFFASSDGWAGGTLRANLPGGVQLTTPWYEYNNFIADSTHPIVSGGLSDGMALSNTDLYSNYCSHGYFSALPGNAKVILQESNGYPTLVEYGLGQGRVIASTLTWEHNWMSYVGAGEYGTFARKALDDLFLYAFSSSGVVDGIINVFPNAVPADGVTTANVTLAGATPGHSVRLISSRNSLDTFANAVGVIDNLGRFATTIRSATPGTAVLTARDLTTGQTFPASTSINFTNDGQPPAKEPIAITDVQAEHPLDARYLERIPVDNRINVRVDWKGSTPGHVDFILNDSVRSVAATNDGSSYTFDMGKHLRPGMNTLRIVAYNTSGQAAKAWSFAPWSTPMPVWMFGLQQMGLASLPLLASGDVEGQLAYEMGFHLPPHEFKIGAPGFGVPDGETKLGFDLKGSLAIPLYCVGSYKTEISAGSEKGFKFLQAKIEGRLTGKVEAKPIGLCAWELPKGSIQFEVEGTRNIYRKPVLVMVAYFNAAVGVVIEQTIIFLHVEELVAKVLGEFYIDGKVNIMLGSDVHFMEQNPYFQFRNLSVGGGLGIEGGYRYNIPIFELKVYAGANGSVEYLRQGPVPWPPPLNQFAFDNIVLKGEVGAEIRSGWFERSTKGEISWTYPQSLQAATASIENLTISNWQVIPHAVTQDTATFHSEASLHQAFVLDTDNLHAASLAPQNTITSVLVSNVYTYTEPALAVNQANNQALLLWVHDDINKPVGQAHEIQFSRWNGTAWSAPVGVTSDNRLDSAPQVRWIGNGNAVAIWQRLNDLLPPTATLDATTTRKIEIATATYNSGTNTWSPVTLLTTNQALDMVPVIARNNAGNLVTAWRQNSGGLLGGDAANPDHIITTFYTNGWGAPQPAVENIPGLIDLAVGYGNNSALIAYTQYLASPTHITPTLQLFTSAWNGSAWSVPVQRTNEPVNHRVPQIVYNHANQPLLIWLAGDKLRLQNLVSGAIFDLTVPTTIGSIDEFRVTQDADGNLATVFTAQQGQRDLFVAVYDQIHQLWGKPHALTHDHASEAYPSPAFDGDGRLLLAYAATAINSLEQRVTSQSGETVTFKLPTEGQTDLMTLAHDLAHNLTLSKENFTLSNSQPLPGETITLAAIVTNTGDLALDNVTVAFYDGDPVAGGSLIDVGSLATPLAAGFTATVTTNYLVPVTGGVRQLFAFADPNQQITEADETDNLAQLTAFGPDLALTGVGVTYWGGNSVDLVNQIANVGTTTSTTSTIAFYRAAVGGTLVLTDILPAIAAGEQITLTVPWSHPELSPGSHPLIAVVNAPEATVFVEANRSNNTFTTTIQAGPDLMLSPYALQTSELSAATALYTVTLSNIGNAAAAPSAVKLYRRGDLTQPYLLASLQSPTLAPQTAIVFSGQLNGPLGCGLYIQANPEGAVQEISQSNNLAYAPASDGRCASFYSTPGSAIAPATVVFTDTSTGDNTAWLWDFGDGSTSTERHPSHRYSTAGTYSVSLTVSGADGIDTYVLPQAVRIYQSAQADFIASPRNGPAPHQVNFTDQSSGDIASWLWDFGDGSTSISTSPVHIYQNPGVYPVTLSVSGLGGGSTRVQSGYITVSEPVPTTLNISASLPVLAADGVSESKISVQVLGHQNNPLANQVVSFQTDLGVVTPTAVTDATGRATATLTASTTAGMATVTASAGNVQGTVSVQFTTIDESSSIFLPLIRR